VRSGPRAARVLPYIVAGALACDHAAPFAPADQHTATPLTAGSPTRITYSAGDDRTASWLPDGSAIVYSSEQLGRRDHDRCLQFLPPTGGRVVRRACNLQPVALDDSTDRYEAPAAGPDGSLVYTLARSWIGLQKGPRQALVLGTVAEPFAGAREISPIPYFASNGRTHSSIAEISWAGPGRIVYLGQMLFYEGSTFLPDTFYTGLDVVVGVVRGPSAALTVVPNTDYASGVSVDHADPDLIYFTLGGDSRVYRQSLATGARDVVFDFGAGHIVRDPQVYGRHLVAVIDGSVLYGFEGAHGFVQRDEGGDLAIVDLDAGTVSTVSLAETLFRRPVIAPDGTRFVVEASPRVPVHQQAQSDFTAINHRPDLWLFDLP
jgi:hypothetical protein